VLSEAVLLHDCSTIANIHTCVCMCVYVCVYVCVCVCMCVYVCVYVYAVEQCKGGLLCVSASCCAGVASWDTQGRTTVRQAFEAFSLPKRTWEEVHCCRPVQMLACACIEWPGALLVHLGTRAWYIEGPELGTLRDQNLVHLGTRAWYIFRDQSLVHI